MADASIWDDAPPGWMPLEFVPEVIAEALQCDAGRVAGILRPLIETGAVPYRDIKSVFNPDTAELGPGALIPRAPRGSLDPDFSMDWHNVFSAAGAERRKTIDVNYASALELVRRALIQNAPPDLSVRTNDQTSLRKKGAGGRPALPEREQFQTEIRRRLLLDGVNVERAAFQREMLAWAEEHFDNQPDRRTLERWFNEHAPKEL